jgi:hypothetical protein
MRTALQLTCVEQAPDAFRLPVQCTVHRTLVACMAQCLACAARKTVLGDRQQPHAKPNHSY